MNIWFVFPWNKIAFNTNYICSVDCTKYYGQFCMALGNVETFFRKNARHEIITRISCNLFLINDTIPDQKLYHTFATIILYTLNFLKKENFFYNCWNDNFSIHLIYTSVQKQLNLKLGNEPNKKSHWKCDAHKTVYSMVLI